MGLFKEVYCAHCGKKAGLFTRTKLTDGKYLCAECWGLVPSVMSDTVSSDYDYEDYKALLEYIEYSNQNLRPLFHQTHSFYSIRIDTQHGLLCFDESFSANKVYFQFRNLADFGLVFRPEEYKEGMLNDKVTGKILMTVKMKMPYFYCEEILDSSAKATARSKMFSSKIEYENPKGMDDFLLFFQSAWERDIEQARYAQYEEDDNSVHVTAPDELQQAMTLFMLDSLENVSLEDIKAHRNRLIKAFHPDKGTAADTAYAQKINNAYEVLKQHLS